MNLKPKRLLLTLLLAFIAQTSFAAEDAFFDTIFECHDQGGDITYADRCPPGTIKAIARHRRTGQKKDGGSGDIDVVVVTLYSAVNCDACDLMRNFLENNGVNYNEKSVTNNRAVTEELIRRSDANSVPLLMVGEKIIRGYDSLTLKRTFDELNPARTRAALPGTDQNADFEQEFSDEKERREKSGFPNPKPTFNTPADESKNEASESDKSSPANL